MSTEQVRVDEWTKKELDCLKNFLGANSYDEVVKGLIGSMGMASSIGGTVHPYNRPFYIMSIAGQGSSVIDEHRNRLDDMGMSRFIFHDNVEKQKYEDFIDGWEEIDKEFSKNVAAALVLRLNFIESHIDDQTLSFRLQQVVSQIKSEAGLTTMNKFWVSDWKNEGEGSDEMMDELSYEDIQNELGEEFYNQHKVLIEW